MMTSDKSRTKYKCPNCDQGQIYNGNCFNSTICTLCNGNWIVSYEEFANILARMDEQENFDDSQLNTFVLSCF